MPLTPADEKQFSECFEMFDEEDVGEIKVSEIKRIMNLLGWDPTKSEIENVVKAARLRINGNMKKSEFLCLMDIWCQDHGEKLSEEDLKKAFSIFDKDGSGVIDKERLTYVMQGTGEPLTDEEVRIMIAEADTDGDGNIDYQEFVAMMRGENKIFQGQV